MSERERQPGSLLPVLLAAGTALYGAYTIRQALLPFVLSFAVAYVLTPLVDAFEAKGLRRFHIVLAFYLVGAAGLYLLAQTLVPLAVSEVSQVQTDAPVFFSKVQHLAAELQSRAARHFPSLRLPIGQFAERAYASALEQLQHIPAYLLGLFPLLSLFFLVPFITFFLLLDGPALISSSIQAAPSRYVEQSLHLLNEVDAALGHYLRGILIIAMAITAASYVGLLALGLDAALVIAVLSGVSSFVPYLGAVVGALVGGIAAFIQFGTFAAGLKVVALFVGIRLADEALLQPFIARYSVHLHPLVFLFSMMVGGEVFGFLGLVFAVPVACIVKALLGVAWEWYVSEARLRGHETRSCLSVPYT
ncbi:MAG: AI-2E family transporter [Elusimicrobia bacterium]|nr:AI-2E family transporter [Elusimicrobiota bacterium]